MTDSAFAGEKMPPTSGTGTAQAKPETPPGQKSTTGNAKPTTNRLTTSSSGFVDHSADNPTPVHAKLPKASTNIQWSEPIGLHIRETTDEPLRIFQRATGINSDLAPKSKKPGAAELGHRQPMGMYGNVLRHKRRSKRQHFFLSWLLNFLHLTQVVIGATLTALGPTAAKYAIPITVLGAINTVIAGVLGLMKGNGLPERLHKDEMEYRKLQEWIEETEALLATGVIGRDRLDIGVLVQSAFRKYNSAKLSAENNRPDSYVPDPGSQANHSKRASSAESEEDGSNKTAAF